MRRDAAFAVGVTPGSSHATYAKLDHIDNDSIVKAFNDGRTMVSYFGDGIIFEIDGRTSGDILKPGDQPRKLKLDAWGAPGEKYTVRVVRNGEDFIKESVTLPEDGHFALVRRTPQSASSGEVVDGSRLM